MSTKISSLEAIRISNISNFALAYGHFSTIHPGHIRYLKYAKESAKSLIVAIDTEEADNSNNKYPYPLSLRVEGISSIQFVDHILPVSRENLSGLISELKPSKFILGNEHRDSKEEYLVKAQNAQIKCGGKVIFHAGESSKASSELLESNESQLRKRRLTQFRETCSKLKITSTRLISNINEWSNVKLLVLGDTIIDQYASCEAVGMSAEAPVIVVKELSEKTFIGGAAIVASHITALGAKCSYLSVIGKDSMGDYAHQKLINNGVKPFLIKDSSRPTTFKKRYVVENQKLFRVSKLEDQPLNNEIEQQFIEKLREEAPHVNGIVISDFVYGIITERILNEVKEIARRYSLSLFGDVQCSSQVGSILRFSNFTLLAPNEREARYALQDKDSGIERLSQIIIRKTLPDNIIMKLGASGFIAYEHQKDLKGQTFSQHFPSLSVNPVDVTGAGDSILAAMSVGLSMGQSLMETSAIASCMASLVVEQMGNIPVSIEFLEERIKTTFAC